MNAIQEPSHESENARLLPAPAYPDLSADRQLLLKERFMSNLLEEEAAAPRIRRRKHLTIGLAAPLALAAAAALAVGVSGNQAGPATARPATSTPTADAPVRIVNVGYTVDIKNGTEFKLTVLRKGGGKINGARLQKDLAGLGLNATVTRAQPKCGVVVTTLAKPDGRGNYVATFTRQQLGLGPLIIYVPMGPNPKIQVGVVDGNATTTIVKDKARGDFLVVSLPGKPSCNGHSK